MINNNCELTGLDPRLVNSKLNSEMKKSKLTCILSGLIILATFNYANAQQGFGTANPNLNSVIDLTSTNKGLLMPRVALTSTGNFTPLTAHVAGMTIYNTATVGDVTPGFYYNDGTKWLRTDTKPIGNWNLEATSNLATTVNDDIYQMGKVGIGTNNPSNPLHVSATTNPIKIFGLKEVTDVLGSNVIFVNPIDGIWKTSTVNLPLGYVLKATGSQVFPTATFASSPTAEIITFTTADELVVDNGFVTLNNNQFKITAAGTYDIYAITNLLADASGSNFSGDSFVTAILKLQKSSGGGAWTDVVSTVSLADVSGAYKDITTTLSPITAVVELLKDDLLRLVMIRGTGAFVTTNGNTGGNTTSGIRTSSTGNGVTNSKIFKIIKLK